MADVVLILASISIKCIPRYISENASSLLKNGILSTCEECVKKEKPTKENSFRVELTRNAIAISTITQFNEVFSNEKGLFHEYISHR